LSRNPDGRALFASRHYGRGLVGGEGRLFKQGRGYLQRERELCGCFSGYKKAVGERESFGEWRGG